MGRVVATLALVATIAGCTSNPNPQRLEELITQHRLEDNEKRIAYIEEAYPPAENVVNVTAEALRSKQNRRYLEGNIMTSSYAGVSGELERQLQGMIGKPVLAIWTAKWCPGCVPQYNEKVIPFAKEHPEVGVIAIPTDEKLMEVAGPEVQILVYEKWGARGFPQYIALDESGDVIEGTPTHDFEKATEVLLAHEPVEPDQAEFMKGWLTRARIAYEKREPRGNYLRPAMRVVIEDEGERILIDSRIITTNDQEHYATTNYEMLKFIAEQSGVPFRPSSPEIERNLWQSLNVDFHMEGTPKELAGYMAWFFDDWGSAYAEQGAMEPAQRLLPLAREVERYHAELPEGGPEIEATMGACVTVGPPGKDCGHFVSNREDVLDLFSEFTGIEVVYSNLPEQYKHPLWWGGKDESPFEDLGYAMARKYVDVRVEGDATLESGPARIILTPKPDVEEE